MWLNKNTLLFRTLLLLWTPSTIMVEGPTSSGEYGSGLIFAFLTKTSTACKMKSEQELIKEMLYIIYQ